MKNCVSSKLAKITNDIDQNEALNVLNSLTASHDRVLTIYNEALADGDRKTALMAINTEIKLLDLSHKIGLDAQEVPKEPARKSIEVRAKELREFLEIETGYDVEKQREIIGAVLKYANCSRNSQ